MSFSRLDFALDHRQSELQGFGKAGAADQKNGQPGEPNHHCPKSARLHIDIGRQNWTAIGTHAGSDDDGTHDATSDYPVVNGDPLLQSRFSLKRIDWLTPTGPASGKTTAIADCFGLAWDGTNSCWTYNHGDPNNILTLDKVAQANREPDFFELLKAAILNGSLGCDPGPVASGNQTPPGTPNSDFAGVAGFNFTEYSSIPDLQILQIGANIIDQYDADSYPTAIYLNKHGVTAGYQRYWDTVYGIEDLPYLYRLLEITFEHNVTNPLTGAGTLGGWIQPQIWNPHQRPNTTPANRPTAFRISAHGQGSINWHQTMANNITVQQGQGIMDFDANPSCVYFSETPTSGPSFRDQPIALTTANTDPTPTSALNRWNSTFTAEPSWSNPANQFLAICAGTVNYYPDLSSTGHAVAHQIMSGATPMTFILEYMDSGGIWRPYSLFSRFNQFNSNSSGIINNSATYTTWANFYAMRPDPRTDRFSASGGSLGRNLLGVATYSTSEQSTLNYKYGISAPLVREWPMASYFYYNPPYLGPYIFSTINALEWKWMSNLATDSAYYQDPDGVVRPGDGYRCWPHASAPGAGGIQYHTAAATPAGIGTDQDPRRPLILNRPFRSVGELGYVSRDLPFKTLDFWSKDSADAALLDVFSVQDEPKVVAGEISPNNAPVPVLSAVFAGAANQGVLLSGTDILAGGNASGVAAAISGYISSNGSLTNRGDLVSATSATGNISLAIYNALGGKNNNNPPVASDRLYDNKAYGETPIRALADVTNIRTWNLLIDVVAQTGIFPPNAPSNVPALNTSFNVQGEKRYWLHIAIDRFTGKVVDQQLEPVYE